MINYDYPDIFLGDAVQKNLLITDGVVTVTDDDYTVTDDTVTITNSELETEAFELHQSLCSDMQLRFGNCESASISFVFHGSIGTIKGKTVKVYIYPNHEASKMLQLGVFKVQSDKVSYEEQRHVVTAYDAMYDILNKDVTDWYDTILQDEDATCTLDDLRYTFLNQFDIEVETRILPNDNIVLRRTIEPEMLSGADVIRAICEINGVFGMITNEGKFRYVPLYPNIREPLSPSSVYELPVSKYISINNDDYDSKEISGVRVITNEGSYTKTVPGIANNIYTISGNFLISDFKGTALQTLAQQLMITVSFHYYQPTVIEALGNPIIEPGDPIKVATKTGYVYTYALQRHMRGVQALRDTYTANGEEYANDSLNSSSRRFTELSQQIAQASQAASVTADNNFVEIIRNIGFRLLDEPSNVSVEYQSQQGESDTWVVKNWNNLPSSITGSAIWTDGEDVFYSDGTEQYILDRSTNTWNTKVWNGLTSFYGAYIWTDGDNIYYSFGSNKQYVLDKLTSTWNTKTWNVSNLIGNYVWTDGDHIYYSAGSSKQYVLDKSTNTWVTKTWIGLVVALGTGIWSDGSNIYFSQGSTQYVLDKTTDTWTAKTWYGLTSFDGDVIWDDGTHIYYSSVFTQYVLDKSTSTWVQKTWQGLTNFNGNHVWKDNGNIYFSGGSSEYVLSMPTPTNGVHIKWTDPSDIATNEPCPATWAGTVVVRNEDHPPLNRWDGTLIEDSTTRDEYSVNALVDDTFEGEKTYYYGIFPYHVAIDDLNNPIKHYRYTKVVRITTPKTPLSGVWVRKTWIGVSPLYAQSVWTDGDNYYYSNGSIQFKLDETTNTWRIHSWNKEISSSSYIWTDGENIYYSGGSSDKQYVLNKATGTWNTKTWYGNTDFYGDLVWTDGDNYYYSNGSTSQYVLNKSTSTWSSKAWNGYTPLRGSYIWTDGTNIYYSSTSNQYVLDKSTSTWTAKTWNGNRPSYRSCIWTDGTNIYYSDGGNNYVLDKSTSTWTAKIWIGANPTNGNYICTINNVVNILYFFQAPGETSVQHSYTLDSTNDTWTHYTPKVEGNFIGRYIWTDGEHIYHSLSGRNALIDDIDSGNYTTPTWYNVYNNFYGTDVWSDGENTYFSYSTSHYVFDKAQNAWVTKTWNGLSSFFGTYVWTDGENIYYTYSSSSGYVLNKSTSTWESKTWNIGFTGSFVWTDGENVYYSNLEQQYVLDKSTGNWQTKTWNGLSSFSRGGIWTDGDNIYYSTSNNDNYVLDKSTSTWTTKSWEGLSSFIGSYVWNADDKTFYSNGAEQYELT